LALFCYPDRLLNGLLPANGKPVESHISIVDDER
jgi:hypothetical protein